MAGVFLSVFFLLGLIVGSFINVFIARYQTGLGFHGRSFCFSCGRTLSWRELIPVLSFMFQRGRCKRCKTRISWRYPIIELTTGAVFVLIVAKLGPFFSSYYFLLSTFYFLLTAYYLLIFSVLLTISFYDLRHKIIPNSLVYFFITLALLSIFLIHNSELVIQNLFAGPLLALPLSALWFFSKGAWIGFGDVKFTLGVGWLLGFSGGLAALILAFWIGAVVGVTLIVLSRSYKHARHLFRFPKRLTIKSEIPFAPFIALGTFIAFLHDISFADIQALFM